MNINIFIIFIFALLLGIYNLFTPNIPTASNDKEQPQLELFDFTIYTINEQMIESSLGGAEGKKYELYYEIDDVLYRDLSKPLKDTISSDYARYESDILKLEHNVHYSRADGLSLRAPIIIYDKNRDTITSPKTFISTKDKHRVSGTELVYNSKNETIKAQSVSAVYHLK